MSDSLPSFTPVRPTDAARLVLAKLAPETGLSEVFARACEVVTDAVCVERAGVWLFVDNNTALRCADVFERSNREHSSGAILRVSEFPQYFASLNLRKSVPAEVAATDPRTAELASAYLNPLGITSMLDAGIFLNGELVGVVCLEHVGPPCEWTTEARDFAGSVADLLAARIQSAEVAELQRAFCTQQERLAEIERAWPMEQMVAGLAHDFRNLLTVVIGNAEMMALRGDLSPEHQDRLRTLTTAAEKGAALAGELLEFVRPASRPSAVMSLVDVVAEFIPVLQAAVGPNHPVQFSTRGRVGQVMIEKGQFARVLMNLVMNARDATPDGGPIAICVRQVRLTEAGVSLGSFVLMEVTDHGVGMDEEARKRAFEPYFTTKEKGTGIGLAVVRRLVDRAGGIVRIDSRPGDGTTVRVFYPRIGAPTGDTAEYLALTDE